MEKCNRYESLYIFQDEKALFEHLDVCEDCRKEYEEDQKTALLVKEVKPYLLKEKKHRHFFKLRAVAALMLIFLCFYAVGTFSINRIAMQQTNNSDFFNKDTSIIKKMGLPTDEYGLLEIE